MLNETTAPSQQSTLHERLLHGVIEGLLFASPKPMSSKEIRAALQGAKDDADEETAERAEALAKLSEAQIKEALRDLAGEYALQDRAFQLKDTASGWLLVSRAEYGLWVRQLFPELKPTRLTAPGLETLAIIAYRQPLTRADMEAIRGVSVDGALQTLLDRGLVKIAGRAETPGRPLLYETTIHFLEHFGLRSLTELPNADELGRIMNQAAETSKAAAAASQGSKQENKQVIADVPARHVEEVKAEANPASDDDTAEDDVAKEAPESDPTQDSSGAGDNLLLDR